MVGYASAVGLGDDKGVAFALVSRMADVILLTIGSCVSSCIMVCRTSFVVRQGSECQQRGTDAP